MKKTTFLPVVTAVAALAFVAAVPSVHAAGNLATKDVQVVTLDVGTAAKEMAFGPSRIKFETGKAYVLKLVNRGKVKHEFASGEFLAKIYVRKVEAGDGNGVEIKGTVREIELKKTGDHADLYFVPVEPGEYEFFCELPGHREAGMVGTFVVE